MDLKFTFLSPNRLRLRGCLVHGVGESFAKLLQPCQPKALD